MQYDNKEIRNWSLSQAQLPFSLEERTYEDQTLLHPVIENSLEIQLESRSKFWLTKHERHLLTSVTRRGEKGNTHALILRQIPCVA